MISTGLIVACDLSGVIGYNGSMPWREPVDLARFKELTFESSLIMGRKTYDSLPGKKLSDRRKYVITKSHDREPLWNTNFYPNLNQAIVAATTDSNLDNRKIWIIGGGEIYKESLEKLIPDQMDLTIFNYYSLPDYHDPNLVVKLPNIPLAYKVSSEIQDEKAEHIWHRLYEKR